MFVIAVLVVVWLSLANHFVGLSSALFLSLSVCASGLDCGTLGV